MKTVLVLLGLAYVQNISFSIVSRARNRDNFYYHASAATASNLVWFATFKVLFVAEMNWWLAIPYIIGCVAGSLTGAKVSMWIEKKIGAKA